MAADFLKFLSGTCLWFLLLMSEFLCVLCSLSVGTFARSDVVYALSLFLFSGWPKIVVSHVVTRVLSVSTSACVLRNKADHRFSLLSLSLWVAAWNEWASSLSYPSGFATFCEKLQSLQGFIFRPGLLLESVCTFSVPHPQISLAAKLSPSPTPIKHSRAGGA